METSSATLAAREVALNKAYMGREHLQRMAEEKDEAEKAQKEESPPEVRNIDPDRQGRIDFYA